ncbi:MAG: tRNA-uridine aminocarboxypropyltransferase [Marinomonas sp.]|jgi:DTW domain-containing protein YfiP
MARNYCEKCHYLVKQCICDLIPNLVQPLKIVIFQHPKEAKHAKNTIKLVAQVWPDVQCIILPENDVENTDYFEAINHNWCLLYPGETSQALEYFPEQDKKRIEGIVLIDATWRKAYKLLQLYPELQALPKVSFATSPQSVYEIRKAPSLDALSSLEALAHASQLITGKETKPLVDFMVKAQARLWQQRPTHE